MVQLILIEWSSAPALLKFKTKATVAVKLGNESCKVVFIFSLVCALHWVRMKTFDEAKLPWMVSYADVTLAGLMKPCVLRGRIASAAMSQHQAVLAWATFGLWPSLGWPCGCLCCATRLLGVAR